MSGSPLRPALRAALLLGWVAVLLGPYVILLALWPKQRHRVAALFFKGCLRLTGLTISVTGWPAPRTSLFAVNHVSYLDIPVLGVLLGDGVFVAKNEVAGWPLLGFLARLAGTEFIARLPADARNQCYALAKRLDAGAALIVFPEGTSSPGKDVRPFKTTLFAALDFSRRAGRVQPVSIAYDNDDCAWHGDMTLTPHLWALLGRSGGRVNVTFHDPIFRTDFPDRKALAKYCEAVVKDAVKDAHFTPSAAWPIAAE